MHCWNVLRSSLDRPTLMQRGEWKQVKTGEKYLGKNWRRRQARWDERGRSVSAQLLPVAFHISTLISTFHYSHSPGHFCQVRPAVWGANQRRKNRGNEAPELTGKDFLWMIWKKLILSTRWGGGGGGGQRSTLVHWFRPNLPVPQINQELPFKARKLNWPGGQETLQPVLKFSSIFQWKNLDFAVWKVLSFPPLAPGPAIRSLKAFSKLALEIFHLKKLALEIFHLKKLALEIFHLWTKNIGLPKFEIVHLDSNY